EKLSFLESVLHGQLHDPGIACGVDLPKDGTVHVGFRIAESAMVQDVEGLNSEIEDLLLSNGEGTLHGDVQVPCARTDYGASSQVPVNSRASRSECLRIEPLVDGRIDDIGISHQIRPIGSPKQR